MSAQEGFLFLLWLSLELLAIALFSLGPFSKPQKPLFKACVDGSPCARPSEAIAFPPCRLQGRAKWLCAGASKLQVGMWLAFQARPSSDTNKQANMAAFMLHAQAAAHPQLFPTCSAVSPEALLQGLFCKLLKELLFLLAPVPWLHLVFWQLEATAQ